MEYLFAESLRAGHRGDHVKHAAPFGLAIVPSPIDDA
jgi:hypothetical protein